MTTTDEQTGGEPDLEKERLQLERERFEFQQQLEKRKLELEKERAGQARREAWLRVFGGAVVGALITASVAVYGIQAEYQRTERARAQREQELKIANDNRALEARRAEENRRSQTLVQMVNARQTNDANLRARMFEALLQNYFKEPDAPSKVRILQLMALNFRDTVQVKPLFEALDAEIEDKELLRDAARYIIDDQLKQIRLARNGVVCEIELTGRDKWQTPSCFPLLSVALVKADPDAGVIEVRTNTKNGFLLSGDRTGGDQFDVNYFDMPMIDYTGVTAERNESWKYSIVLERIDSAQAATVAVAVLPSDSYSNQDEYRFDELLSDYVETKTFGP